MPNYITNAEYRKAKSALTRARNSGNPQKVIDVCVKTLNGWSDTDTVWPDDWHRWEVALRDAEYTLQRQEAGL